MKKFILCDCDDVSCGGKFENIEDILKIIEGNNFEQIKSIIIDEYDVLDEDTIKEYYFDGDMRLYIFDDSLFEQ